MLYYIYIYIYSIRSVFGIIYYFILCIYHVVIHIIHILYMNSIHIYIYINIYICSSLISVVICNCCGQFTCKYRRMSWELFRQMLSALYILVLGLQRTPQVVSNRARCLLLLLGVVVRGGGALCHLQNRYDITEQNSEFTKNCVLKSRSCLWNNTIQSQNSI
jgi:hypothetical protein